MTFIMHTTNKKMHTTNVRNYFTALLFVLIYLQMIIDMIQEVVYNSI